MRQYELMVILDPRKVDGDEAVGQMLDKIQGIITGDGGRVVNLDRWGRRRLAYEIGGTAEGYYVVLQFETEPKTAAELARVLRITEGVLRHLIVRPYPVTRRAQIAQAARRRAGATRAASAPAPAAKHVRGGETASDQDDHEVAFAEPEGGEAPGAENGEVVSEPATEEQA